MNIDLDLDRRREDRQSGQLCGLLECHFQLLVGKKRLYSLSFQVAYVEENRHQRCYAR